MVMIQILIEFGMIRRKKWLAINNECKTLTSSDFGGGSILTFFDSFCAEEAFADSFSMMISGSVLVLSVVFDDEVLATAAGFVRSVVAIVETSGTISFL